MSPHLEDVILDASCLIRKAAVLSQRAAKSCKYTLLDSDVFISSAQWEETYGGGDDSDDDDDEDEEEEEDPEARMQIAMSQDY